MVGKIRGYSRDPRMGQLLQMWRDGQVIEKRLTSEMKERLPNLKDEEITEILEEEKKLREREEKVMRKLHLYFLACSISPLSGRRDSCRRYEFRVNDLISKYCRGELSPKEYLEQLEKLERRIMAEHEVVMLEKHFFDKVSNILKLSGVEVSDEALAMRLFPESVDELKKYRLSEYRENLNENNSLAKLVRIVVERLAHNDVAPILLDTNEEKMLREVERRNVNSRKLEKDEEKAKTINKLVGTGLVLIENGEYAITEEGKEVMRIQEFLNDIARKIGYERWNDLVAPRTT